MSFHIQAQKVTCRVRNSIPKDHQTIADDYDLDGLIKHIKSVESYFRDPKDCPFERGNWIVDLTLFNDEVICIKLPKEMEKEKFENWVKPLIEKIKKRSN